jgi:hypothetical protein
MLGAPVTMASYDRQLWEAAKANGLIAWPQSLPWYPPQSFGIPNRILYD